MITLLEDLRLYLLHICRAIGLSGTAATVLPLVVLGVALNLGALSAMESMRAERPWDHSSTALRSAARTEMKVVRTVFVSALKKIGEGQRNWCPTQQRLTDRRTEIEGCDFEPGFIWADPGKSKNCDVAIAGSPHRMAIAFVQC